MIRHIKNKNTGFGVLFFLILFFTSNSTKCLGQDDIFNCENSKKFAVYLYNTNQHKLAIQEFERISFFCASDSSLQLLQLKSYRKAGQLEKENQYFTDRMNTVGISNLSLDFRDEYLRQLMMQARYDDVVNIIQMGSVFSQKNEHYLGALLMQRKWNEAESYAKSINQNTNYKLEGLYKIANQSNKAAHKLPFWAGVMSAIIPGSGKMYCGYWGDGLISLAFTASTALFCYRSFEKYGTSKPITWIAGGMAISYYSANIYGGAKSAVRFNDNIDHDFIHQTEHILFSDY